MTKCKSYEFEKITSYIKKLFGKDKVGIHEPLFIGKEKEYVVNCIESTFVSSVGNYVNLVEKKLAEFVNSKYAIATVNGTCALHLSLVSIGVDSNTEVITQPLTFVATCNAISYTGAKPIFIDVDIDTLGMSPTSLKNFLEINCILRNNKCINKKTKKRIKACVPMHTFGHPCKISKIKEICDEWNITLIEDSAESLGSFYKNKHTGTFGKIGIFSFNGNKIVTSGGGGMVVTNDEKIGEKLKHLSTTAKIPHKWNYFHNEIGYNYRMPNINAALLLGQLENLKFFNEKKRELAEKYEKFFKQIGVKFIKEPDNAKSNYWLNAILFDSKKERDEFLEFSNNNGVMTRAVWTLMNKLPMYKDMQKTDLSNAEFLEERIVNIPSGVIM